MQLNYGILSTSSIAPRFIAAVRSGESGEILALSSRTEEKAREKATLWNIPQAYGSHEALLGDPDVNIVYISTVNALHFQWAMAALEAGKHVICEKPMTTSADQTRQLFAKAREKGVFLMEAEKMLFLPAILEVKRRIDAGQLGQMYMAELSHSFPASYNGWMFDAAAGGGPLLSSGIYAVQLLQFLFGSVRDIRGTKSALDTGVEWQYILTGEMENGLLFSAKNSTRAVLDNTAKLCGTAGWVEIPEYWKARKVIFHMSGAEPEILEFPCAHELIYEARHIQECMDKGLPTSPVVTEEVSLNGIAALEKVKANW